MTAEDVRKIAIPLTTGRYGLWMITEMCEIMEGAGASWTLRNKKAARWDSRTYRVRASFIPIRNGYWHSSDCR